MHQIFNRYFLGHNRLFVYVMLVLLLSIVLCITLQFTGHLPLLPVFQTHLHGIGPTLFASDPLGGN